MGFVEALEVELMMVWEVIREIALRVALWVVLKIVNELLVSRRQ